MKSIDQMSDEDFDRHAFAILQGELGVDGLTRFLRLNRAGMGSYTQARHHWLDGVTIREIMAEVDRSRDLADRDRAE